nr:haloacid dehalogenase-like hydrolase domain-containing protein 3 [Pogona vitticeps]
MQRLKLQLLTWDVKDTLLRLRVSVGQSYAGHAQAYGLQVSAETVDRAFRKAYGAQSQHFPNYGLKSGLTSQRWWMEVVSETFRLSGLQDEVLLRPLVEKLYWDYSTGHNWELLPGARETLEGCRALGIPMGVVSNFDRRLPDLLSQCDLREHFQFILTSEEAGFAKPDRRIFLEALRIAGVAPNLAAHVGDDYENDYVASRAVGMHGILLKAPEQPGKGEAEVPRAHLLPSLPHLLSLVEQG